MDTEQSEVNQTAEEALQQERLAYMERAIAFVDKTPAVTWTGKGGVKERLREFMERSGA